MVKAKKNASKSGAKKKAAQSDARKALNLALQGGGAHGAFTWGVLDKLLEDGRIDLEAISGTSAGAREALHDFWKQIAKIGAFSPIQRSPLDIWQGNFSLDHNPAYLFFDMLTRMASPYDLNPANINPMRDLLETQVDFDRVRCCSQMGIFISATNVHTGRVKVFTGQEINADVVLASSCLPLLFQAVEIDGVPYWDGGYMGNPVLFPFFYHSQSDDILLVQINPMERVETPQTSREILNRLNEITFNASLNKELRAIEFVSRLIETENLDVERYKRVRMHMIEADDELSTLSASSKLNAEWAFLVHLRDIGRLAASDWLAGNFQALGVQSTFDLTEHFRTTRIEGEI